MSHLENIKHSVWEDAFALINATLFVGFGVVLYKDVGLLSGGTVGVAFLLHYLTHWNFSVIFFVINLPFYWMAWQKMGHEFTIKTFCAVAMLSLWTAYIPDWVDISQVNPLFATVVGGLMIGGGFLMLIRHKSSLGGVGIVAIYLQQTRGWRAGKLQMGFDVVIVALAFIAASPDKVAYSILGAVVMNLVLAINHRQGRYLGM
ncbi:YitT family protein [Hydromonas duriensis]|uniref:Putative 5xTM membrane YitT family protein n=1 Tax=Hydromonas duriensis TaxID=1527608 RepID=A0A4R6Y7F9_9BURK|nr:YitT family protein [Hydromonas duriensis]TDR31257.1 putative 5xTM membrane YitT family protein [Hydromonas duriensis]